MAEAPDPYAVYRQGRVPIAEQVTMAEGLHKQDGRMRTSAGIGIVVVAFFLWGVTIEFHERYVLGAREGAVLQLAVGIFWSVVGIIAVVRDVRWRKMALRELVMGEVRQAEGTISWYRRRYAAVADGRELRRVGDKLDWLVTGRYHLFYLPESRLLVAAEWSDEPLYLFGETLRLAQANGFDLRQLAANRRGRVKDGNVRTILWQALGFGTMLLVITVGQVVAALVGDVPAFMSRAEIPGMVIKQCLWGVVGFFIVFVAVFVWPLRGRVDSIVGRVQRTAAPTMGSYFYYFQIGELRFRVEKAAWDALDDRLTYRTYYRASTTRLLNM